MEITIYKETKYNKGRSKCRECKDPFEDGTKQLKTGYNNGKLCFICGRSLLEAKIEEYLLLRKELIGTSTIQKTENEKVLLLLEELMGKTVKTKTKGDLKERKEK